MSTEIELGFRWIYSTLSGDSTLQGLTPGGVSRSYAQPGTSTPYVIMSFQSGTDVMAFGGRAYSDMFFQVVAVAPTKVMQSVLDAAARIDVLLTVTQKTNVTGGVLLSSFRSQPYSNDSLVDGETWSTTGGIYQIMAKAS